MVAYNRDFEGAEADPENKAREDIKDTADYVIELLAAEGFDSIGVGITGDVAQQMASIKALGPDVVFNLCESINGDNRFEPVLPLLLELEGIAYTGSGPFALGLALRKEKTKEMLAGRGVPVPRGELVTSAKAAARLVLRFPLIVKPAREDASVGISSASVVHDRATLAARVTHVLTHYRQPALVEEFVEGREIYVSLLARATGEPQVFPFYEIDFSEMPAELPKIVSFEGKWVEDSIEFRGTRPVLCSGLSDKLVARIAATARAAFAALDLRDYARVDVRLAADGIPYVIDVNPNCDLSPVGGGYAKAAKAGGLAYKDVILRLVELALARRPDAQPIPLTRRQDSADPTPGAAAGKPVPTGGNVVRARASRRGAGPA